MEGSQVSRDFWSSSAGMVFLSDRFLQTNFISKITENTRHGSIHLLMLVVSVILLVSSLTRWLLLVLQSGRQHERFAHTTPLAYTVALLITIGASFALSVISCAHGSVSRAEPVVIGYVICLQFAHLVTGRSADSRLRILFPRHRSMLLVLLMLLSFARDVLPSLFVHHKQDFDALRSAIAASFGLGIAIIVSSPRTVTRDESDLCKPFTEQGEMDASTPDGRTLSPEEYCSPVSYCVTYGWLDKMIFHGYRHTLSLNDLPPLPHYDEPLIWLDKILSARKRGVTQLKTMLLLMHRELFFMTIFAAATAFMEFVAPFAMNRLLSYLQNPDQASLRPTVWVALLFLGPVARSLAYQQYLFTSTRLVVRTVNSMIQEIYHKAMDSIVLEEAPSNEADDGHRALLTYPDSESDSVLTFKEKPKSRSAFGVGHIMNLMSFDVDAVFGSRDIILLCVAVPIEVAIGITFLYTLIGWSSLVGLASMILTLCLPAFFSHRMVAVQQGVMKHADERISKVSEYLNSIRVIKYFGWEDAVAKIIKEMRRREQAQIWKRNLYAVAVVWSGDFIPLFSLFVMFTTYALGTDRPLPAATAFTCLAIVETLRQQFIWVSNVSGFLSQAAVSFRRLDKFFQGVVPVTQIPVGTPSFQRATFGRSPTSMFHLEDLDFSFVPNQLNVITGPTGSGKSTMLLSLLGETVLVSGTARCPSDVAYVSQTAWLQSGTVRDNITFHSGFDKARYDGTVRACGLLADLDSFPEGDLTEISEQGASLSGGQRQRVALARAVYSSASTLLMDDIFSALDVHTTNHIFNELFRKGYLGERTVILVSHLPSVIQAAKMVVELENGRVASIVTQDPTFAALEAEISIQDLPCLPAMEPCPASQPHRRSTNMGATPSTDGAKLEHMLKGRVPRTFCKSLYIVATCLFCPPATPWANLCLPPLSFRRWYCWTNKRLVFKYMLLFGGYPYAILALCTAFSAQVAFFSIALWLSVWTGAYSKSETVDVGFYLGVYGCVLLSFNLLVPLNNVVFQRGGWNAARKLHERLTQAVLNSPLGWFDSVPIGNILNRFSQDMSSLDSVLLNWLRMTLDNQLRLLLRIGGIASILPIFALPAAVLCSAGFMVGEVYTTAQMSIKRLTSATTSPIFAHFSETLIALPVIRAQKGMRETFGRILANHLRNHSRSHEALYNSNRWVSVRADAVAASVSAAAGAIAIMKAGTISAGLVGFSLTNAIGLSQTILTMVRNMNELEVELNSFQRVLEFTQLESEEAGATYLRPPTPPPAAWPARGEIKLDRFSAGYEKSGPDVLKNLSLHIRPGERVGVVGRTGSGKSSLALSLLRFTQETGGSIVIDGVDISSMSLKDLRRMITIIPQESTLLAGTIRSNLDPFDEMDDAELNHVLRGCSFLGQSRTATPALETSPSGSTTATVQDDAEDDDNQQTQNDLLLSTPVAINGSNFSRGERQSLCMARAVCRRSKIVILDEATSSVDSRTDALIQSILRTEFKDSTVLTIAHRLKGIMDYDRVLVMSAGEVVELDTPKALLARKGVFWGMVRDSGEFEELVKLVN